MSDQLVPQTIYLAPEEIAALEAEAKDEGRSGVSAQVRFILMKRRRDLDAMR